MKITVTNASNKEPIYIQVLPDSKRLHKVLARLSDMQAGSDTSVLVENNGHEFKFSLTAFDIEPLIRDANGIITKTPSEKKAVATASE